MPTESYQRILRAPARSLVLQSFQLPLKGLNTIDRLRNEKKHRRMENASDVRLTRTEPRQNNQTQNNREMKFCHTNPPFVVETSPVFAPQNLRTPSSTTRFHSPLYPPLNNLTPLKILFPYKMNAPHPLPFLFQLRTLSSPTFYQQFLSTINFTISSLPSTLFLASSLSFLHLSRFLSHFFSSSLSFPYFDFFFRFTIMSRVLLSLLLTFSFHSLISQRHLRTFRGVCTFPAFFFPCWFSFAPPLFLSLLV